MRITVQEFVLSGDPVGPERYFRRGIGVVVLEIAVLDHAGEYPMLQPESVVANALAECFRSGPLEATRFVVFVHASHLRCRDSRDAVVADGAVVGMGCLTVPASTAMMAASVLKSRSLKEAPDDLSKMWKGDS